MKTQMIFVGLLFVIAQAKAITIQSPFGRTLDLNLVEQALKSSPEKLFQLAKSQDVDVYLLPSEAPQALTSFLAAFPRLSKENYIKFGIDKLSLDQAAGIFISASDVCCDLKRNFIIVGDQVDPLTLIHELMHADFYKKLSLVDQEIYNKSEKNVESAERIFKFRFDKVFTNVSLLSNELWRRDILNSLVDYFAAAEDVIRMKAQEEVIIERSLQGLISQDSPLYNQKRLEQGEKYAQERLNHMKVVLRDLEFVSSWTQGEIKVLEDTMPMQEKYELQKKFKELDTQILSLAQKFTLLKNFKLRSP